MKEEQPKNLILNHHYEAYRAIARYCGGHHGQAPAYEWALAPPGNAYPNFIFNEQKGAIGLETLQQQIAAKELPPFWISPDPKLEGIIGPAGFRLIRIWEGMAVRPAELAPPPAVPGLECHKVDSPEYLDAWTEIVASAFNTPFEKGYFYPLLEQPEVELFLGRKDGEFVATAMNFYRDGSVGLHHLATRPTHRKQGIGQWMMCRSIRAAFDSGARVAVCSATPDGSSPWKKIGFKVYSKLYLYWLVGYI